jgi:putative membrane protein
MPSPAGTTEPAGSTPPDSAGWRRLNPRMLLLYPVQELPRALPALFGLLVAGSSRGNGQLWSFVGVAIVVGLGVLRWVTTSYRITPDQVQVRRGLLRRQVLTVPRDRVRTVDVTAHVLHRLLGVARVNIGTGQSDRERESGIRLDGLSAEEAAGLREELLHRRARPGPAATGTALGAGAAAGAHAVTPPAPGAAAATAAPPVAEVERELARLDPAWVRFGPFTLSGVVTLGVLAGFLSQLVNEAHVDPSRFGPVRTLVDQLVGAGVWLAILEVVAAAVLVVAIASTLGYVLAFWGFRLVRHSGGTLQVTRGLVTMRATTIEERRLRGVELSEPLLLRAVGGARCIAIATGLRVGRGAERGGSMLLPPAPRAEALRVAAAVLGRREPVAAPLRAHGPVARRRRYTRALPLCALLAAAAAGLWWWAGLPAWVVVASLALLPLGALLAADRYRSLGHGVVDRALVSAYGSLLRRRNVLACDGIIGWNLRQSFFQRRAGLVTLTATTAAGRQAYRVQDVSTAEALRVAGEAIPGLLTPFLAGPAGELAAPAAGERRTGPAGEPPAWKAPIRWER